MNTGISTVHIKALRLFVEDLEAKLHFAGLQIQDPRLKACGEGPAAAGGQIGQARDRAFYANLALLDLSTVLADEGGAGGVELAQRPLDPLNLISLLGDGIRPIRLARTGFCAAESLLNRLRTCEDGNEKWQDNKGYKSDHYSDVGISSDVCK